VKKRQGLKIEGHLKKGCSEGNSLKTLEGHRHEKERKKSGKNFGQEREKKSGIRG